MPVIPTFQPGAPPDSVLRDNLAGQQEGQSWMTQNLQRAMVQQQMDQKQQLFNAALPTLQLKNQADQAALRAQIDLTNHMNTARTDFYNNLQPVVQEYTDAMKIQDQSARVAALNQVAQKITPWENLPEAKNEAVSLLHNITNENLAFQKMTFLSAQHKNAMDVQNAITQRDVQTKQIGAQAQVEAAQARAGAEVQSARERNTASVDSARIKSESTMNQVKSYESMADRLLKMSTDPNTPDDEKARYRSEISSLQTEAHNLLRQQSQPNSQPQAQTGNQAQTQSGNGDQSKLYSIDPNTNMPVVNRDAVKTHGDVLNLYNQMVKDGVISADDARAHLLKMGFVANSKNK